MVEKVKRENAYNGGQRLTWTLWFTICFSIFISNNHTRKTSRELSAYFRKMRIWENLCECNVPIGKEVKEK